MGWIRSLCLRSCYSTEAVLLQRRLSQMREMLTAMLNGQRVRGALSIQGADGFSFNEDLEGAPVSNSRRGEDELDQHIFCSFPEGWSFVMEEVYMALRVTRTSDRWISVQELSNWTGLGDQEVGESLHELEHLRKVQSDDCTLWKCKWSSDFT